MAAPVKVTFAPEQIALSPGESADLEVSIQNASQVVEHFATTVLGLPRDDLYSCEPAVVKLRPREMGTVRVRINVPERGGLPAGPYLLGLLVRSPYQRDVSRCEELPLELQPAPALTMTVQPEVVTGGKTGMYAISAANEGNTPLAVALTGSDPENRVGFEFQPRELYLEPETSASAQLTVHADAPLTGQEVRRTLTLQAHTGDLVVDKVVTFVQRPRIAGGWMKAATIAAGVAVLAAATVGGAMLIRSGKQSNVAQPAAMSQSAAPGAAAGAAAPTSTAGGASSSAASSSASAAGPSAPANGGTPAGATLVDFSRLPDGSPPGNRIISGDLYASKGIKLSADTQNAPPGCKDATAVALRTAGTFGSFLTSSSQAGADLCNTDPVRIDFTAPAHWIRLTFTGTPVTTSYTMTVQLNDGSTQPVTATVQTGNVTYEAPIGSAISSVTFGHTNPDPMAKEYTAIKSLSYTAT